MRTATCFDGDNSLFWKGFVSHLGGILEGGGKKREKEIFTKNSPSSRVKISFVTQTTENLSLNLMQRASKRAEVTI